MANKSTNKGTSRNAKPVAKSKFGWKALGAFIMVVIVLVAGAIGGWYAHAQDWFKLNKDEPKQDEPDKSGTGNTDAAILGDFEESGIAVKAALLPIEAYAANGVAEAADTAYLLSYTVTPADATDKSVNVSVDFVNPSSAWAQGKDVADYVTAEYQGGTSVLVTCLAPFGEQMTLTLTAKSNEDATAKCTVDYLRKPVSVSLKAGSRNLLGGSCTLFAYKVNKDNGGKVELTVQYTEVYTMAGDYKQKVSLSHEVEELGPSSKTEVYCAFNSNNVSNPYSFDYDDVEDLLTSSVASGMYFDKEFCDLLNFRVTDNGIPAKLSEADTDLVRYSIRTAVQGRALWLVTVTVTCEQYTYTAGDYLTLTTFDATKPASDVSPDVPGIVF